MEVAKLVECLPSIHKDLGSISSTIYPGTEYQTYNPSTWEDQKVKVSLATVNLK